MKKNPIQTMGIRHKSLKKILVVRNDKLGDFILSIPSFATLKATLPDTRIYALVPRYTAELATFVPYIDKLIIDEEQDSLKGAWQLAAKLKAEKFDAIITLFSTLKVGIAAFLANIPLRYAPASKLYQVFYNKRLLHNT